MVNPLPTVESSTFGNKVTLTGNEGTPGYEFSIDGGAYSAATEYAHLMAGDHDVIVRDSKGCENTGYFYIELIDIEVPEFFSPNGDGVNDRWEIKNIEMYPDAEIEIYDRYGKLLIR